MCANPFRQKRRSSGKDQRPPEPHHPMPPSDDGAIEIVLRTLLSMERKIDQMALDFTSFDADLESVKQEVAQLVAAYQAAQNAGANDAANAEALAQRDAALKALRDQIAGVLAPVPAV